MSKTFITRLPVFDSLRKDTIVKYLHDKTKGLLNMKDTQTNVSKNSYHFTETVGKWLSTYITKDKNVDSTGMGSTALKGFLSFLCAVLFSSASSYGGTMPYGVAFLSGCENGFLFILAGVMIGAYFTKGGGIYMISCLLVALLRLLVGYVLEGKREKLYKEPAPLRMAIGAAGGFIVGIYRIFDGGFKEEQLYEAFFLIIFIPISVYMFSSALSSRKSGSRSGDICSIFLYGVFISGMSGISIVGFSPAIVGSVLLTLCTSVSCGGVKGALTGMIGAMCCGYSTVALGLLGGAAGALKKRSDAIAICGGCGLGVCAAFLHGGTGAIMTSIPALLWGGALSLPICRFGYAHRLSVFEGNGIISEVLTDTVLIEGKKREDTSKKLTALSDAMASLSSVFYALSNRLSSPGAYKVREICESSFKKYCSKCALSTRCWGRNYELTADAINKLAIAVATHGNADSAYVDKDFLTSCPHAMKALSDVNLTHARLLEEAARQNKTEVFALDYEAMAKLLTEASEESAGEYQIDMKLSERARRAALQLGMSFLNIAVYGKRKKTLIAGGIELGRVKATASDIQKAFSTACGIRFTLPEYKIDDGYILMSAASAPVLTIESARASSKKKDEEISGDSTSVFENREGRFYALISDGMGSGAEASMTSKVTAVFLEKLLLSGNKKSTVLKMLNNFIRHKNLECFTTVDLLEIDTITSEASFVKSGAAASYIIREGKLFKISSTSLPIGITREISSEEIRFDIKNNDLIIMVSDGISQSFEDGIWLLPTLSEEIDSSAPLTDTAKKLLEKAKEKNGRSDDMSVIVMRVELCES